MAGIADEPVEALRGHDDYGVLVGSAVRSMRNGRWQVTIHVDTEEQARTLLTEHGARQVIEERKQR